MKTFFIFGEKRLEAKVQVEKGNATVTLDGQTLAVENVERLGPHEFSFTLDGKRVHAFAAAPKKGSVERQLFVDGRTLAYRVEDVGGHRAPRPASGGGDMAAPMPGKILKVFVKEGDAVRAGQPLLILEAMKMEHTIGAARDGTVKHLRFQEGDRVEAGEILCEVDEGAARL